MNNSVTYNFDGKVAFVTGAASGISYCLVTLLGVENGKNIKQTIEVYYNDEYIRKNNQWLIVKRKSTFAWIGRQEQGQ